MTGAPAATVAGIDLAVGDPARVRACARRLRRGATDDLRAVADRQADGRRSARGGWEGASAGAYGELSALALAQTEAHAQRVHRAADAVDAVADRLADLERTMDDVRDRARADGHLASGDLVQPRFGTELRPADQAGFERLRERAQRARDDYAAWVDDRLGRAAAEAADDAGTAGLGRALRHLDGERGPGPLPAVGSGGSHGPARDGAGGSATRADGPAASPGGAGGDGAGAVAGPASGLGGVPAAATLGGATAGGVAAYVVSALGPPPTRDHVTGTHPDPLPLRPPVPEPLLLTAARDDGYREP